MRRNWPVELDGSAEPDGADLTEDVGRDPERVEGPLNGPAFTAIGWVPAPPDSSLTMYTRPSRPFAVGSVTVRGSDVSEMSMS